mgnify:CR=1 FL=1
MKKTIIALIALCGVSMGANLTTSDLVTAIGTKLDALGYEAGDSFTITFTLAEHGWSGANYAGIIGLGTPFGTESSLDYLRLETSSSGLSGAIIGMAVDGASIGSGTAEYWNSGTIVADPQTSTYTKTFDSPANAWMQFTPTVSTGTDALPNNSVDLKDAAITLSYDYTTSTSSIKVVTTNNVTSVLNYKNTTWDAKDIAASGWSGVRWGENVTVGVTQKVPEPATATLGLLALAGLCARRRRG